MLGEQRAVQGPAAGGGEERQGPSSVVSRCCLFQEPGLRQNQVSRT